MGQVIDLLDQDLFLWGEKDFFADCLWDDNLVFGPYFDGFSHGVVLPGRASLIRDMP